MSDMVPMTREKYNALKAEIDHLENVVMPEIAEKIAEARAEGDLKENAEYHGQRERQGQMQARINDKKNKMANAFIIDPAKLPKDEVGLMATVKVKDLDFGDEEEFTIVGLGDEDYDSGKILSNSPIGAGLLGKKVGTTVEIPVPKGKLRFQILSIDYRMLEQD